MITKKTFT